jgi:hypothetical protein
VSSATLVRGDPAQRRLDPAHDVDEVAALHAWRRDDIDELVLEPDDLQLLAHLRVDEDAEAPTI